MAKISEEISAYKRAYEASHKQTKYITVSFYKGDIKNAFERKTDGRKTAIIGFPKGSKYEGFVFFFPADWIHKDKDDSKYKTNEDHRWISLSKERTTHIIQNIQNDKGSFVTVAEKDITSEELKEAMKRKKK